MIKLSEAAKKLNLDAPYTGMHVLEAALNRVTELEIENQQLRDDKEAILSSASGLVDIMDEELSKHVPKFVNIDTKQSLEDEAFKEKDAELNQKYEG